MLKRVWRERLTAAAGIGLAAAVGSLFIYAMHRARRAYVDPNWAELLVDREERLTDEIVRTAPNQARELLPEHVLQHVRGHAPGDWFGWAVAGLDDVDGDGTPDFAVGAIQNRNFGTVAERADPGYVEVFSSRTGERLYRLVPEGSGALDAADDHFGARLSGVGDLDGDGTGDLLVGAYLYDAVDDEPDDDENSGAAMLYSGRSGALLRMLPGYTRGDFMGMDMLPYPDFDGDGVDDLLISVQKDEGRRGLIDSGSVCIFSGADFTLLARVMGPGWKGHMGTSLAVLDDHDGDGDPEFATGAHKFGSGTNSEHADYRIGVVGIFSPHDAIPRQAWRGDTRLDRFGHALAALGDANGDGYRELAIAAPQSFYGGQDVGPGYVRVIDPRAERALVRIEGAFVGGQFGWSLARADDIDGDGVDDLLIGAPAGVSIGEERRGLRGVVHAFSGADHRPLAAITAGDVDGQFGIHIARVGDVDGDGRADYVIGSSENDPEQTRPGSAYLVSGAAFAPAGRGN